MIFSYENIYKTNWQAHILANEIFTKFDSTNTLVFSTTWAGENDRSVLDEWLKEPTHKAIIISLFDPNAFDYVHPRATHIDSKDILFWMLASDRYFLSYTKEDTSPKFEYSFLCYQRKPIEYRVELYNLIKNKKGIITLGNQEYEFNKTLPDHPGYKDVGGELPIPNDIYSLGNIDIWNKSFLNIVSETIQSVDSPNPFLSEKTFKPIIGMRPFIVYGNMNTSKLLQSKGFETFDDDFGFTPKPSYHESALEISRVLDDIDNVELLYQKLLPKITHNYENFHSIAQKEWKVLDDLVLTFNR